MNGGWVLELDIQGFFDSLDHGHLRSFLDQRVRDGVLRRTIDKWLKAGVMEDGVVSFPDSGSPQGGVISPLLANVYLHEVLDDWFEKQVRPRLAGRAVLIRYADDAVIAFSSEADARRVMDVLPKRFGKYGLTLHPEKTRLVPFRRPPSSSGGKPGDRPGTFDLLGFTHYWGRSYRGFLVIKRQTARSRLRRALDQATLWCRANRHQPVIEQHRNLNLKLRGHYGYYGITGNFRSLKGFRNEVSRVWRRWLDRRSQRAWMTWTPSRHFSSGTRSHLLAWFRARTRGETVERRAGCANRARPDPWEPRGQPCPEATRLPLAGYAPEQQMERGQRLRSSLVVSTARAKPDPIARRVTGSGSIRQISASGAGREIPNVRRAEVVSVARRDTKAAASHFVRASEGSQACD